MKNPNIKKHRQSRKAKHRFQLSSDYSFFAVGVLLLTTVIWAFFSAKIQASNADQLINSYLFENYQTFHGATLPSAHSFLIKWPLFMLIKLFAYSAVAFITTTVIISVATVGSFAYILHKIEPRPAVFGTLCLGLASVLLLVPPQPYAGGILPVNMAMLATRNIEYILYIYILLALSKSQRLKSSRFWLGAFGLTLLGASDKLFVTISIGGALLALAGYFAVRRWVLFRLAARWLIASLLALGGSWLLLKAIDLSITNILGATSPYALAHSLKDIMLGLIFGLLGIATNFGANPAFDSAVLRDLPVIAHGRLLAAGGFSFITNGLLLLVAIFTSTKFYISTFIRSKTQHTKLDNPLRVSVMMVFSSLAAIFVFAVSDHYYVVDARYLTIILFSLFMCMATYTRRKYAKWDWQPIALGCMLTISVLLGTYTFYNNYYVKQAKALADVKERNMVVVQALRSHPVHAILGDYWRTVPLRTIDSQIRIEPLDDCTHVRTVLSSTNWQYDISTTSFAYLLSLDKSLTNYPNCTLDQILATYGRPNSTVLIKGQLDNPTELLLFYDRGSHQLSTTSTGLQSILPITPEEIPLSDCEHTILNIVAHQDDDLLFLSPDLIHEVQNHDCVRTVYVTAGDAGSSHLYWLAREHGSEAAYSLLNQSDTQWIQRTVKISDNKYIILTSPKGNRDISLIFMRLADGNQHGHGFGASHFESLERLTNGQIPAMHSVDGQSTYSSQDLIDALAMLMEIYRPDEIHTQQAANLVEPYPDHSDHAAVGRLALEAYKRYSPNAEVPMRFYVGYPIKNMPANIDGADLALKTAAFLAYGKFDGATCHSEAECREASNYGAYLQRQYIVGQ